MAAAIKSAFGKLMAANPNGGQGSTSTKGSAKTADQSSPPTAVGSAVSCFASLLSYFLHRAWPKIHDPESKLRREISLVVVPCLCDRWRSVVLVVRQ